MSKDATRSANKNATRLASGDRSRGGSDCGCCPICYVKPKLCGTDLDHPTKVVPCVTGPKTIRLDGETLCYYVNSDFETFGSIPEGYSLSGYTELEGDCEDCAPITSPCTCCFGAGDTGIVYFKYFTPPDWFAGETKEGEAALRHGSGTIPIAWTGGHLFEGTTGSWPAGDSRRFILGGGAVEDFAYNPTVNQCVATWSLNLDADDVEAEGTTFEHAGAAFSGNGYSAPSPPDEFNNGLIGSCKSLASVQNAQTATVATGSPPFRFAHLDLLVILDLHHCNDGEDCVDGEPDADGNCILP